MHVVISMSLTSFPWIIIFLMVYYVHSALLGLISLNKALFISAVQQDEKHLIFGYMYPKNQTSRSKTFEPVFETKVPETHVLL